MDLVQVLVNRLREMAVGFMALLPQLVIGLVILLATWTVARFAKRIADRLLARTDLRPSLANLSETLITVVVWVLGILIAMSVVLPSVTPANLLATLGLGSVAIGFAFKDIFENFLAGVLIMLRRSMKIGDIIECEGLTGRVEHISLRDTHLRVLSNELVIVPNSFLYKNPMKILTEGKQRRFELTVGVSYDTDLDAAARIIRHVVETTEGVDPEKRIDVFALAFGASSIDFRVRWWTDAAPYQMWVSRDRVIRGIKRALDEAGIEIPFPYQTLTFKEPLPIRRVAAKDRPPQVDAPPEPPPPPADDREL